MDWKSITHETPLVTFPWDIELPLGKLLVANALWARDLSAAVPELRPKLEALWGLPPAGDHWPLSVPYRCWEQDGKWMTEGVSGCGITYDGISGRAGVAWPWWGLAYHTGTAVARDQADARRQEHVVDLDQWEDGFPTQDRPESGDGVIIGSGLATHILMACWWEGDTLVSIDGGQANAADKWLQSIRLCRRKWQSHKSQAYLENLPVVGWVRTSRMPWREDCQAPAGWESLELPGQ